MDARSSFLDDLLGVRIAESIRSIFGSPLYDDDPYSRMVWMCDCGASYLGASLSSLWALLVLLVAFMAGVMFHLKRGLAYWMLGGGVVVSLIDTGLRVFDRLQRYPLEYRETMIARLPSQILANAVFQFALPVVTGLAVALALRALRSLISDRR